MARGQVLNNHIENRNEASNYIVDYFITNDKECCDVVKKVTKSLKQQEKEKIKTKIDTIYGYDDGRYEKMGSRKRNRWINDNFINHPIARQIHYEAEDINAQYPVKSPSPFTKLVNLCHNGINISSFIDINDDRQRLFLKRISKYTNAFINKDNINKASYGPENLTRLDRRLKQNLTKKPQYKEVIENYEKNIRLILLKIQKENSKKQYKEKDEEEINTTTVKKTNKDKRRKNNKKKDLSEKLIKLGKKIKKENKSELSVFENMLNNLNQKHFMISWKIDSEFHRLIVHSICRWYGLPSYSKDKEEGRYTYIEINPNESDLKERLLNTFVKYIYE
ncbi:hypothetical protein H8356DRAFT_1668795 [Neocallimastix lanati (nom. inval.)]|jgi:hypothetical protein|uniref:R3H domain-containing protein n=1 Tax=Neocallimastix californiae TaxID=1754190 RepID=A0A1Y2EVD0_9FUNG|nr:hypothetical protein H8356DRAFT_1668795 [Neocallimastix sp. JGI-2020a]ORY75519.1 hypothetical protein LY90DRAFT_665824 [Neocallimastix californiae]|eukprot:ORY75519.1 hypothetical protein LY90DRAFT_665824 [Neocallimastix californiae]